MITQEQKDNMLHAILDKCYRNKYIDYKQMINVPTCYWNNEEMEEDFDCDVCHKTHISWSDAEKCEEYHKLNK